jgi:hypothetical protein
VTIAKVAGVSSTLSSRWSAPGVAVVLDTVRAATGEHAEQLGLGEVKLRSASPGPGSG